MARNDRQQILFLVFNHTFTAAQEEDARSSLGVTRIVSLPEELQDLWSDIPPSLTSLSEYLAPIRAWLLEHAAPGDYVLIQGDFGATYLMVDFVLRNGLVAIYSTTTREATETIHPDGSVELMHHFKHQIYRNYGG